ncbi:MAG: histone deacetylase [Candidatus Eisenbacteria bacterium]
MGQAESDLRLGRALSDGRLRLWASDAFLLSLPAGHPFPVEKYRALRERLLAEGVVVAGDITDSEPAPVAWLKRVHDPAWVERVLAGRLTDDEVRRLGLPGSPAVVARARAAVYGTVQAAFAALEDGVAGNLAGGTHHAFRERAEGYCLFNDHAVAIAALREAGHAARPFIVDLDVHQGNGTAALFAADPTVFTFSMHGRRNYPLHKETSSLDVELEDGTGDDAYLALLDLHFEPALERHRPDLVLYQAGVDAHEHDRLGRLRLTHAGLAARDARVFAACEARSLPLVLTLGGGYGRPLESTIEAHAQVFRGARAARDRRAAKC